MTAAARRVDTAVVAIVAGLCLLLALLVAESVQNHERGTLPCACEE